MQSRTIPLAATLLALASQAPANVRPISPLGDNQIEPNLQEVFDGVTLAGAGLDVVGGQTTDAYFSVDECGAVRAALISELGSMAAETSFGLFDAVDRDNRAQIFSGSAVPSNVAKIRFFANGDVRVNGKLAATGFGRNFGFYIHSDHGIFYSDDAMNGDGKPHALVYRGNDVTVLRLPSGVESFSSDHFVAAFEDVGGGGDRDYQDVVVIIGALRPAGADPGQCEEGGLA
jgi:hypothetical protein